ncbi:hypothetical protein [Paramuribaculum intestinale]|uniref:hypothetical protein n=1 Tax=Paramuribaculum intestinale TaxID=2094151 RepID=UPI0025B65410|nr:hypothetical protein [Paramuribaculum intestinale]
MIGFTIDRFQAVIPVTDHSGKIKSFLFYGKKVSPFLNTLNNPKPAPDPAAGQFLRGVTPLSADDDTFFKKSSNFVA